MNFAERLQKLMQITGITRYRISKEVGCSPSTVTNWLNGTDPTADRIQQVADYFGVSADYLLGQSSHRYQVTKGFLRLRQFLGPEYRIDTYDGWCFLCLTVKKGVVLALHDIPEDLADNAEFDFKVELFDFTVEHRPFIKQSETIHATLRTLKDALEPVIGNLIQQGGLAKKESPADSEADSKGKERDGEEDDDFIILNRAAKRMTPEKRKKLLEMAKLMFAEDFEENE